MVGFAQEFSEKFQKGTITDYLFKNNLMQVRFLSFSYRGGIYYAKYVGKKMNLRGKVRGGGCPKCTIYIL